MGGTVTIKDVAKAAGVSVGTVSFCLNGTGRTSADTRKKVLKIAKDLNYVPNLAARELTGKSSRIIGVILPEHADEKSSPLLKGIEATADENGYFALVGFSHNRLEREQAYLNLLKGKNIDGLIIFPLVDGDSTSNSELLLSLKLKGMPIVCVDTYLKEVDLSYCVTDNYEATFKGTKYLIDRGHKRIGFVGGAYYTVGLERLQGYVDAMEEAGLYDDSLVYTDCVRNMSKRDAVEIIEGTFLDRKLSSIVAYSRISALAAIDIFKDYKNEVDFPFGIITFDLLAPVNTYGLDVYTFKQPSYEMGQKAMISIIKAIEEGKQKVEGVKLKASLLPVSKFSQAKA